MWSMSSPRTLGALREAVRARRLPHRAVKDELRENLIDAYVTAVRCSPGSSATTTRSCRRS